MPSATTLRPRPQRPRPRPPRPDLGPSAASRPYHGIYRPNKGVYRSANGFYNPNNATRTAGTGNTFQATPTSAPAMPTAANGVYSPNKVPASTDNFNQGAYYLGDSGHAFLGPGHASTATPLRPRLRGHASPATPPRPRPPQPRHNLARRTSARFPTTTHCDFTYHVGSSNDLDNVSLTSDDLSKAFDNFTLGLNPTTIKHSLPRLACSQHHHAQHSTRCPTPHAPSALPACKLHLH